MVQSLPHQVSDGIKKNSIGMDTSVCETHDLKSEVYGGINDYYLFQK